jgi:hypothetical protein
VGAALTSLVTSAGSAETCPAPRPFVVDASLLGCRLRVGAEPGDLALQNHLVTAVVRKSDGSLVDFWPNYSTEASGAELAGEREMDGIWLMNPAVDFGKGPVDLAAQSVRATEDAIETQSELGVGSGRIRVVTRYELDATRPRLLVTTEVVGVAGGQIAHLLVGDRLRWGNADYYIDNLGVARAPFRGRARAIGRRGAGGDLSLSTAEASPMLVSFRNQDPDQAPEIRTVYRGGAIEPGSHMVVRRALAYQPIQKPAASANLTGTLVIEVTNDQGQPLAAKLSLRGIRPTPDPSFGPRGGLEGSGRFVFSGRGHFARTLPPGRYQALVTSGFERRALEWKVTVGAGETVERRGVLGRVLETPGWISADLHLHQAPSVDSDLSRRARVVAAAAEGLELVGASDHFATTDLGGMVTALVESGEIASPLLTLVGTEVSTIGPKFGHFNFFPLPPDARVRYENTTPHQLFSELRAVSPRGFLQVNHPRLSEVGYWQHYQLDPVTRRVPAEFRHEYASDFDAVEVMNGGYAQSLPQTRAVLFDWMALLGQGHRYTATGNSDSHRLAGQEPGIPRNFIHYGSAPSDEKDLEASVSAVLEALRQGRVVVSTGPFLDLTVNGMGPGDTVQAGARPVHVRLVVRAAPWIDVTTVELFEGGDARRIRYFPVPRSDQVVRIEQEFDWKPGSRTFLVAVAQGKRDLPHTHHAGIKPFSFTNPVWIEP